MIAQQHVGDLLSRSTHVPQASIDNPAGRPTPPLPFAYRTYFPCAPTHVSTASKSIPAPSAVSPSAYGPPSFPLANSSKPDAREELAQAKGLAQSGLPGELPRLFPAFAKPAQEFV